jgi:hypothetical protein
MEKSGDVQVMRAIRGSLRSGFLETKYVDRGSMLSKTKAYLNNLTLVRGGYSALYTALVQSSCWGKSRLAFELLHGFVGFYTCLRSSEEKNAYPEVTVWSRCFLQFFKLTNGARTTVVYQGASRPITEQNKEEFCLTFILACLLTVDEMMSRLAVTSDNLPKDLREKLLDKLVRDSVDVSPEDVVGKVFLQIFKHLFSDLFGIDLWVKLCNKIVVADTNATNLNTGERLRSLIASLPHNLVRETSISDGSNRVLSRIDVTFTILADYYGKLVTDLSAGLIKRYAVSGEAFLMVLDEAGLIVDEADEFGIVPFRYLRRALAAIVRAPWCSCYWAQTRPSQISTLES